LSGIWLRFASNSQSRLVFPGQKRGTKEAWSLLQDHPHQPLDVLARSTQHRMNGVTRLAFQVTAIKPVVWLHVPNNRSNRLAPTGKIAFLFSHLPLHIGQQRSYGQPIFFLKSVASVHVDGLWCNNYVLHQDRGLLNLLCQRLTIKIATSRDRQPTMAPCHLITLRIRRVNHSFDTTCCGKKFNLTYQQLVATKKEKTPRKQRQNTKN
jgi:hypothetical protein